MSRVWYSQPLETTATFWRVLRRDGVTLGFTTHDRDLWFDGIRHTAMPGMLPSAVQRTADLQPDSADVQGALSDDSITEQDLAAGRFDGARVLIGVVDWQTFERAVVYRGTIGEVSGEAGSFSAQLTSRKAELQRDPIPRTSPSCRAMFCGTGCTLSPARYTHRAAVASCDPVQNGVVLACDVAAALLVGGSLRWLDGPDAGTSAGIVALAGSVLVLDQPLDQLPPAGTRVLVREGCDRTIATCASRFANAVNFQGEPYLPGNDLVARTAVPAG